jgi:hypothetical protein
LEVRVRQVRANIHEGLLYTIGVVAEEVLEEATVMGQADPAARSRRASALMSAAGDLAALTNAFGVVSRRSFCDESE